VSIRPSLRSFEIHVKVRTAIVVTTMDKGDSLERARASFAKEAWSEAFDAYSEADRDGLLEVEDLERFDRPLTDPLEPTRRRSRRDD